MPIPPRKDILPRPMPSEYPPGFVPPPDLLDPSAPLPGPSTGNVRLASPLSAQEQRATLSVNELNNPRRRSPSPTTSRAAPTGSGAMRVDPPARTPSTSTRTAFAPPIPITEPPPTPRASQRRDMAQRGQMKTVIDQGQVVESQEAVVEERGAGDGEMDVDDEADDAGDETVMTNANSDLSTIDTQQAQLHSQPQPQPQPNLSETPSHIPTHPAEASSAPNPNSDPEDHGRHYTSLMKALEIAVRKGVTKWSAEDLRSCFPLLSTCTPASCQPNSTSQAKVEQLAIRRRKFEDLHARTAEGLRVKVMAHSLQILEHYDVGPALKLLNETIARAKLVPEGEVPLDAWRPDLTPAVRVAANNLGLYDGLYLRLKEEYAELYTASEKLAKSIETKKKRIAEIEDDVRGSVAQLEETVKTFENFPNDEMITWMEEYVGGLDGGRHPDRVLG